MEPIFFNRLVYDNVGGMLLKIVTDFEYECMQLALNDIPFVWRIFGTTLYAGIFLSFISVSFIVCKDIVNIMTDFLKASLSRQTTVLGAWKASNCTTVKDSFHTTETFNSPLKQWRNAIAKQRFCEKRFRHNENLRVSSYGVLSES
jgi:hypothetical protein